MFDTYFLWSNVLEKAFVSFAKDECPRVSHWPGHGKVGVQKSSLSLGGGAGKGGSGKPGGRSGHIVPWVFQWESYNSYRI